jgi:two-component system chemotaxis sensor kinase CheA
MLLANYTFNGAVIALVSGTKTDRAFSYPEDRFMSNASADAVCAKLEEIAKEIVFADVKDLPALAGIHTKLGELTGLTTDQAITGPAARMADVLEKIIMNDMPEPAKALASLSATVSDMHAAARNLTGTAPQAPIAIELPKNADDEILTAFLSRQPSVLENFEELALAYETSHDAEKLQAIKRILHTLKGEAGVLALTDLEKLCHKVEDIFEKGDVPADCLLSLKDWMEQYFNAIAGKGSMTETADAFLGRLAGNCSEAVADKSWELDLAAGSDLDLMADFIGEAQEHLQNADNQLLVIETNPSDAEAINTVFRAFHTIKGVAGCLNVQAITKLAHISENLLDKARKGECTLTGRRIDVIFGAVDSLKQEIDSLHQALNHKGIYAANPDIKKQIAEISAICEGKETPRLGEILVASGKVRSADIKDALQEQEQRPNARLGEILVEKGIISNQDVAGALQKQQSEQKTVVIKETVKVDTERLDRLVDIIGELVIAESVVTGDEELVGKVSARVVRNMRQLDKITRELQEIGMSMRLVSIKSTFQKMARMVRDLAKKAGKEINFVTEGEDTELDKTVIEHIGDPLVHMIRNSADHGIESPDAREKAGKPRTGTIHLRAFHKGGNINIEIEDDGNGLDKEAILAKARSQHIIKENETLSEQDIFQLIFRPGFSTAKVVTDVSGRGVGMDVVRRNIETLRGNIEIKSTAGKGTVFTIHLPLTMAIMDGMVVKVGSDRYIIPTLSVVESVRPSEKDLSSAMGKGEMIDVHNALIPLFRISRLFSVKGAKENPIEGIIMVVEDAGKRVGLLIDSIVGQQQTVIKTLGEGVGKIPGVSGGAIMTDGCISLILDIGGIVRLAVEGNWKTTPPSQPSPAGGRS